MLSGGAAITQSLFRSFTSDNNKKATDNGMAELASAIGANFKQTLYQSEIAELGSNAHARAIAQGTRLIREDGERTLRREALSQDLGEVQAALAAQQPEVVRLAASDMIMQGALPIFLFAQRTYLMLLKEAYNLDMQVKLIDAAAKGVEIRASTESGYLSDMTTEQARAIVRFGSITKLLFDDLATWRAGVGDVQKAKDKEDTENKSGPVGPVVFGKTTWRWRVFFPFTAPTTGSKATRPWQVEGRGDTAYGTALFNKSHGGGKIYRKEFVDRVTIAWSQRLGYPQTLTGVTDAKSHPTPPPAAPTAPATPYDPPVVSPNDPRNPLRGIDKIEATPTPGPDNAKFQAAYQEMWDSMQAGRALLTAAQQQAIDTILAGKG